MRSLRGLVVSTFRNFRRIFSYIPVLWNNEDWDHAYLYEIERKKLKDMINYMTKNELSTEDWRSIKYMKICVSLLDEMIGDVDRDDRYVNIRNFRNTNERFGKGSRDYMEKLYNERFDPDIELDVKNMDGSKSDLFKGHKLNRLEMFKKDIREEKVYRLYFKIRYYLTDNWWN